jgi:CRP-like cAMP-binding protein
MLSAETFARLLESQPAVARRLTEVASRRLRNAQLITRLANVFPGIDRAALQALGDAVEWVTLSAGEILFRQGDPGDAAYLVVSGRVRVAVSDEDGGERVIGEIVSGELVGEQAILLDTTRSATIFAARDTHLARIPRDVFTKFVESHPDVTLPMIRTIVARSRAALLAPRRREEERSLGGVDPPRLRSDRSRVRTAAARAPCGLRVGGRSERRARRLGPPQTRNQRERSRRARSRPSACNGSTRSRTRTASSSTAPTVRIRAGPSARSARPTTSSSSRARARSRRCARSSRESPGCASTARSARAWCSGTTRA